jgi:methanogenic corrinoid protein MtbC1
LSADVVEELEKKGVRKNIKIILGGAAVDKLAVEKYGVDAAVDNSAEGIRIIESWMVGKN